MKRAAIYLRVSTVDQTTANQERELREIAGRVGDDIVMRDQRCDCKSLPEAATLDVFR